MSLFHAAVSPALDSDGNPINGATWNFYLTQTTTPAAVFSTNALNTSLGSVVTSNAAGRFVNIFLDDDVSYRAILKDAGGSTIKDIDPINGDTDSATAINVMSFIPTSLHPSIEDRTINTDLEAYFDTAALAATVAGRPLHVPKGTYTMATWSPPNSLTVTTDGFETEFKQMNTSLVSQRFIIVNSDNVRLWPNGSATINGGMTSGGVNATSFNSAVQVYALAGETINRFEMGSLLASNVGGDGLETGAAATGTLNYCQIGTIFVDNVYRNGVSITAGVTGMINGIIQIGGLGLYICDFEPDPLSGSPIKDWEIGTVRGNRCGISGDASVLAGNIRISQLYLDYNMEDSNPAFDYGGVNASSSPALFESGLQYRNCGSVRIGQADILNYPREGIKDIGENVGDSYTDLFEVDYLTVSQCGANTGQQIAQQKTHKMLFHFVDDTDKVSASTATFVGGTAADAYLEVEGGVFNGRIVNSHTGHISIRDSSITGASENIFRNVVGDIKLDRVKVSATAAVIFDTCTKIPIVKQSDFTVTNFLSSTTNARLERCTVNGTTYDDRLYTPLTAVGDAVAAVSAPTMTEFNDFVTKFNTLLDKLGTAGAGITQD